MTGQIARVLTSHHHLLLEDTLVVVGGYAGYAGLAYHFVEDALGLVGGVSAGNVDGEGLLVYFLGRAEEGDFYHLTLVWLDDSTEGGDLVLACLEEVDFILLLVLATVGCFDSPLGIPLLEGGGQSASLFHFSGGLLPDLLSGLLILKVEHIVVEVEDAVILDLKHSGLLL